MIYIYVAEYILYESCIVFKIFGQWAIMKYSLVILITNEKSGHRTITLDLYCRATQNQKIGSCQEIWRKPGCCENFIFSLYKALSVFVCINASLVLVSNISE